MSLFFYMREGRSRASAATLFGVANYPTTVVPLIWGFTTAASATVQVQAKNAGGTFVTVATATAAATGPDWNGTTWYQRTLSNVNVPAAYWTPKPSGCGQRVRIGRVAGHRDSDLRRTLLLTDDRTL